MEGDIKRRLWSPLYFILFLLSPLGLLALLISSFFFKSIYTPYFQLCSRLSLALSFTCPSPVILQRGWPWRTFTLFQDHFPIYFTWKQTNYDYHRIRLVETTFYFNISSKIRGISTLCYSLWYTTLISRKRAGIFIAREIVPSLYLIYSYLEKRHSLLI